MATPPPDLGRKITLVYGLNMVVYTDTEEMVPGNIQLYYKDEPVGTLDEIRKIGSDILGDKVYNKNGKSIGTVDNLKNQLTARELTIGGKRKSRRNRKSKKLKKNCKKSNRRR